MNKLIELPINEDSNTRIVEVRDLEFWQKLLDSIASEIEEAETIKDIDIYGIANSLEQMSQELMSISL